MLSNSPRGSHGLIPQRGQTYSSLIATKLSWKNDGEGGSRGYVQVTSAEWGELRVWERWSWCMLVDCWEWVVILCQLVPVWRSVRDEFTGKWESDVWVVRAGAWRPGNLHGSRMGYHPQLISCRLLMAFLPHHRASRLDSIFIHTSQIHFYCVSHSILTSRNIQGSHS